MNWRGIATITGAAFALGLILGYMMPRLYENRVHPLPTDDGAVSRVTVTPTAPLQALDKGQLRKRREIPKQVAADPDKAVTATGKVDDDSGKRTVAAVLDLDKGTTQIIEQRRFAERMNRFELGAGAGLVSGNTAKAVRGEYTFGRVRELYGSASGELFEVNRPDNRHPWNAMVWVSGRW